MGKILCVGEMVIDFLPGREEGSYLRRAGGAPANVAVAAARNGVETGFCGCVGDDDFGRFLVKTLQDNRVAVLCPQLVSRATTTMAFVTLDETGNRSFTFARKPGADMFLTREMAAKALEFAPTVVHAGSCSLSAEPAADATVFAMEEGKKRGCLVSFDINYRGLMWNDDREACGRAVRKILPLVDLLKISDEEEDLPGAAPQEAGEAYGIPAVVETLGAKGARCFWRGRTLSVPGRGGVRVDTTGAGDAFWGAFLSFLVKHGVRSAADLSENLLQGALEYGNVAGTLCVRKKGAMESLPTTGEIETILEAER